MKDIDVNSAKRADELFETAKAKSDAGDEHAALSLYLESLALNRDQPSALYNVGLIYKYRREWKESLRYNCLAAELRQWRIARGRTATPLSSENSGTRPCVSMALRIPMHRRK